MTGRSLLPPDGDKKPRASTLLYSRGGFAAMDHDLVARQQMTERYLLGELDDDARHEFEEHFFDCPHCALDVRAGALFVEQTKVVLAEPSQATAVGRSTQAPARPRPTWLAGLREMFKPAFAAPVMAVLLAVLAYQNLVTYPHLKSALNIPRVLSFASVNVGSWGSEEPPISIHPGDGFLLFVRIPPDSYSRHTIDLYNPAGKLEWSLPILSPTRNASSAQDQFPVQVPGAERAAGAYLLIVRGVTATGENKEVGRASFELQIQK